MLLITVKGFARFLVPVILTGVIGYIADRVLERIGK